MIKLLIKQKSVKFFGNIYSTEGVRADPKKVAAITEMRPSEYKSEVKSFLGMVNYRVVQKQHSCTRSIFVEKIGLQ